jgi:hypothetical protein
VVYFSGVSIDIEDMFGDDFYLNLVNGEYKAYLSKPLTTFMLKSKAPRILVRIEQYFDKSPMQDSVKFSHYRPARYFTDNLAALDKTVPSDAIDRFDEAFKALNALL